jgi:hypothetical protein
MTFRDAKRYLPWLGLLAVVAIAWWIALAPWPHESEARAACDLAVASLLETHDQLELLRAEILIRRLHCSVRRRLPDKP